MKTLFFFALVFIASASFGETEKPTVGERAKEKALQAKDVVQTTVANGGDRREDSKVSVVGEYSPFDLIIPGKVGGAIGYVRSREKTLELEYVSASVSTPFFITDIGSFSDTRVSLKQRSYSERNSFHIFYGLSYFDLNVHVGSSYLKSANAYSDLLREKAIGFEVGVGNRWALPHGFTVGVDWFSWAQPLFIVDQDSSILNGIQDQNAKKTLQDAFQAALFIPRLSVLKISAGFLF